jgi:hypothetical protein
MQSQRTSSSGKVNGWGWVDLGIKDTQVVAGKLSGLTSGVLSPSSNTISDMKWKNKFWGKSLEIVPVGTVNVSLPR